MYILSLIVYTEHPVTIPYTLYSVSIFESGLGVPCRVPFQIYLLLLLLHNYSLAFKIPVESIPVTLSCTLHPPLSLALTLIFAFLPVSYHVPLVLLSVSCIQ